MYIVYTLYIQSIYISYAVPKLGSSAWPLMAEPETNETPPYHPYIVDANPACMRRKRDARGSRTHGHPNQRPFIELMSWVIYYCTDVIDF